MTHQISLAPERGTRMYENAGEVQKVTVIPPKKASTAVFDSVMMIIGNTIARISHLGIHSMNGYMVQVTPNTPYMLMNLSDMAVTVEFSEDIASQTVLYDPYLYEHESHVDFNPNEFKKSHPIPSGYVDTLPKWYSVKFTYPDYNYIFVRPGIGISIQTHMMREEHWDILQGTPIILVNNQVSYQVQPGTKFDIPFGTSHTVINPTAEWILLKETYSGTFDEKDIIRVFNPNHYK
jgi:mannose-6-phosphate isomerase-like protein (cupin superfamily)